MSMIDHPQHRNWMMKFGIEDVNQILSKNEYHSPEESDPENDPNSPIYNNRMIIMMTAKEPTEIQVFS